MSTIKILVVEDEALIADHISFSLEEEGYEVVGIADTVEDAITLVETNQPNLVLLDINLNGNLDGIDLAGVLNNKYKIPFVYLTSNTDEKTLERVKITNPAGFIVKPFQPEDLKPAIELALYSIKKDSNITLPSQDAFFIKEKYEMIKVFYDAIDFAEAADNYTTIHTENKKFLISQTLKKVEEKLSSKGFFRVHRSFLVNLAKITCIRPSSILVNEKVIPLGVNSRSELLKFIKTL